MSLLKAWFGDAATKRTTGATTICRTLTGDHSHMNTVVDMVDGKVKGYFVMGENPVVGSMNGPLQREGLRKLDWLVVRDFQLIETAEFWREAPEIERGEVRPRTSPPKYSSSPPLPTRKKMAALPIRSGCCSGITKRSNRRAIAAANSISSSSWGSD